MLSQLENWRDKEEKGYEEKKYLMGVTKRHWKKKDKNLHS